MAVKKAVRLTRARRTAILKALADPRRFELSLKDRNRRMSARLRSGSARLSADLRGDPFAPHQGTGIGRPHRRSPRGQIRVFSLRPGVLETVGAELAGPRVCELRSAAKRLTQVFPQLPESFSCLA